MHIEQPNIDGEWIAKVADADFNTTALDVFRFQYAQNAVFRAFADHINRTPRNVQHFTEIPFLPIRFFKSHHVMTGSDDYQLMFESSGTTGENTSRHFVRDPLIYRDSFRRTFSQFYGDVRDFVVIGLLPSYLERQHSSLIYMVNDLIEQSEQPESGFYLYDTERLVQVLRALEQRQQKTILIGVTFALLDLAEHHQMDLHHTIIMETGGMKGRREELTREEVHRRITQSFNVRSVHSEYGMTELLSQAYAPRDGFFQTPHYMKVLLRQEDDPLSVSGPKHTPFDGLINVIDFANIHSCSFIATDDVGKLYPDGRFEVSGRLDASDIRGCSLLTA
jgi:phenylacetate-coenzyme A ligase PaaK-like adenylate-forming protein